MGADIHIALGKIKPLAIGYERKGTAIQLAGLGEDLDFSQFEFMNYDEEVDKYDWEDETRPTRDREINRNYDLFGWLAGVRNRGLEPLIPKESLDKLHSLTREFQRWANTEQNRLRQEERKRLKSNSWYGHEPDWSDDYINGDHSHVIYPLLFLKGFDYSQKVRVSKSEWEPLEHYLKRVEEYQDTTYRDAFGSGYLNFLDWSLENGWQFVIFTFDS